MVMNKLSIKLYEEDDDFYYDWFESGKEPVEEDFDEGLSL